jgi:hypothetical protein
VHGGWRKYAAGGLEIHEIDGDHGSIVNRPQVGILAAQLRAAVDRAQARYEQRLLGNGNVLSECSDIGDQIVGSR